MLADKALRSHKGTHMSSLQSIFKSVIVEPLVENFSMKIRASGMSNSKCLACV